MCKTSKHWTEEELLLLSKYYPVYGSNYCSDILVGRSKDSIRIKANKLGLKGLDTKTHEWYENELFNREINIFPIDKYIKSIIPILHECLCGNKWKISPSNVLAGFGCPLCYNLSKKKDIDVYLKELPEGYKLLGKYVNNHTPTPHKHIECGNEWLVSPNNLLEGSRCPDCSSYGFSLNKPATLYHVKITDNLFKIGITNRTVKKRFGPDWNKFNIEVLWELKFNNGKIAYTVEQNMLKSYKHLLVNTGLLKSGNTETMSEEITCPI